MPRLKGTVVFSAFEKEFFLALIKKNEKVIFRKANSTNEILEKEKVWTNLTTEYNCRKEVHPRTTQQLKVLWKNLKTRAKSDVAAIRGKHSETDRHANNVNQIGYYSEQVCSIVKTEPCSFSNDYNDDTNVHQDNTVVPEAKHEEFSDNGHVGTSIGSSNLGIINHPSEFLSQTSASSGHSFVSDLPVKSQPAKVIETPFHVFNPSAEIGILEKHEHDVKVKLLLEKHAYEMDSLKMKKRHEQELFEQQMKVMKLQEKEMICKLYV
ncbi:MSD3-like protein [Mya arenaria]|uniref:MSD3-like protein n=1 Tax=Mya arenaria TaxID=6604 RepID=A0ABY7FKD0_MYAAR|nr:myb/SANT-like DNA-binding domain-containing protein 3 [Mya arenaria]WAR21639.1 MSD3-like protein [Mya arenaria]